MIWQEVASTPDRRLSIPMESLVAMGFAHTDFTLLVEKAGLTGTQARTLATRADISYDRMDSKHVLISTIHDCGAEYWARKMRMVLGFAVY